MSSPGVRFRRRITIYRSEFGNKTSFYIITEVTRQQKDNQPLEIGLRKFFWLTLVYDPCRPPLFDLAAFDPILHNRVEFRNHAAVTMVVFIFYLTKYFDFAVTIVHS